MSFTVIADTLKEFQDDVEKEQQENQKKEKQTYNKEVNEEDDEESDGCCMSDFCMNFMIFIWQFNSQARYDHFPYAGESPYWITYEGNQKEGLPGKRFTIDVETGMQYIDGNTGAFYIHSQSRFLGIGGLLVDYKLYDDPSSLLHFQATGIDMALIQIKWMDWSFYLQYASMKGLFSNSGTSYGSIFHIFPVKPLSLYLRLGGLAMDDVSFFYFDTHMGIMIDRFELYLGYQSISAKYARLGGIKSGIKVWF